EITGYSPATISNALNHKKGVNRGTSDRIFQVAKEIGYISENKISKIKLVVYKRNGLIIDDSPFFSVLLSGVEAECKASGYEMVMCNLNRNDLDYKEQVEAIMTDASSAVILLGTELLDDEFPLFMNASCPMVLLDCWSSNFPLNAVLINNADSASNAVQYLIKKGHREIGYLRGKFRIKAFTSRWSGYGRALSKYNIPLNNQYVFTVSTTMDGACNDMRAYLEKNPKMPTAFFADDDMVALGCIKAFREFGYRVPEDISVIGFDDLPFCEISSPRLTTIKVYKYEMGQMTVRRVIELMKDGNSNISTKTQVCTEFVERDSVADIRSISKREGDR
ncbi:MAG: LacI family DNA-binding transcriptional regulator, partial [Clostridiales bacterium]|nr:LacI family DNA-binding transcriptional regulator [Clostridiales bacterium]